MPDQVDRVLDALADSTKASTQVARRIDALERRFDTLESTLDERMKRLEQEMGTMNAYLDNLVRETQTTNELLRQDQEQRKEEARHKVEMEEAEQKRKDEEAAHQRALQLDTRASYKKVAAAAWEVFRQPLAYLITAIVGWFVLNWLNMSIPFPGP